MNSSSSLTSRTPTLPSFYCSDIANLRVITLNLLAWNSRFECYRTMLLLASHENSLVTLLSGMIQLLVSFFSSVVNITPGVLLLKTLLMFTCNTVVGNDPAVCVFLQFCPKHNTRCSSPENPTNVYL